MSAPEPTTVAPVEEVDATPAVEASKAEEPVAVAEVIAPAVEATPATDAEPAAVEDSAKKPEVKDAASKSPNFLSKLLGSFKGGEKKAKAPKSPKKEKKKEETEAPAAAEETSKEVAPEAPVVEVAEPSKEEVAEPVMATETAAAPVVAAVIEEAKDDKPAVQKVEAKALKVGRRLSARVGDLFKSKPKSEVVTPARVDENPPKIDEPLPVAPLENPASEAVPAAKGEESAKPVEVATPVIAAAA